MRIQTSFMQQNFLFYQLRSKATVMQRKEYAHLAVLSPGQT